QAAPQLGARLLRSAVHYMLLKQPNQALAAYFPTIAATPKPAPEALPYFKTFCRAHHATLAEVVRTRALQTTSVGRAIEVLYALDHVAGAIGTPFSLIEIGCSAGLLLLFDQYRYTFPEGVQLGPVDAAVSIPAPAFIGAAPRTPRGFPE